MDIHFVVRVSFVHYYANTKAVEKLRYAIAGTTLPSIALLLGNADDKIE